MGKISSKSISKYVNKNLYNIFIGLLVVLLLISILNVSFISSTNSALKEKSNLIKEANKPSVIQLSIIDCEDCSDISGIVDTIKNKNVEITDEKNLDSGSKEAEDLIKEYNVQKLPFILISGEIEKIKINNFELINDVMVLSDVSAPYFDINTNELKGKVSIIEIIDSSCDDCVSLTSITDGIEQSGVFISSMKKVEYNSNEGAEMISKYDIEKIPTVLISNDIDYYDELKQGLLQLGLEEKGDFYELNMNFPPYRNLSEDKIVGKIELIMLNDKSCTECYDVESNKQILERFGINIETENTYDVSSSKGKKLIAKYNIDKVPLIIMSPDAEVYPSLVSSWEGIGSVESNGWFVMRNPDLLGTVKNIVSGKIIIKEQSQASS